MYISIYIYVYYFSLASCMKCFQMILLPLATRTVLKPLAKQPAKPVNPRKKQSEPPKDSPAKTGKGGDTKPAKKAKAKAKSKRVKK